MSKVVPFPKKAKPDPTEEELKTKVWGLSKDSENVVFDKPHFQQRLAERGITMRQVLEVLRHGEVIHGPTKDKFKDWRIKLCRKVAGRRIKVVVAVKDDHIVVITCM